MLKLGRRARGHFMMLIEICVHLIRVKPGHISTYKLEDIHIHVADLPSYLHVR